MEIADHAAALHQLIVRLRAWDEGLEGLDDDGAGLASAERAALLDELRALAGEGSAAADPWQSLRSFFSPRGHSPAEERARREHALLCEYERLCERDLPFGVSSMLVRHHSAIKRAANLAAGRLHLPTPPRGSTLAAMAAPPTPPPDAPAAR